MITEQSEGPMDTVASSHSSVMPLFQLLHCEPMEPCEQNIWRNT